MPPDPIRFSHSPKRIAISARRNAPSVRENELEAAKKEGYRHGFQDASSLLEQQVIDQRNEMMHLKQQTFRSLDTQHQELIDQFRQVIPDLVMESLRRIFAGLVIDREMVLRIVNETLHEITPGPHSLEVTLSPHDLNLLKEVAADFRTRYPAIEFRADPDLLPGDCKARTRFGDIDGRISTKLKTIEGFLR